MKHIRNFPTAIMIIASICFLLSLSAFAATWEQQGDGSWRYLQNGAPTIGWQWIDGNADGVAECYYFDAAGIMQAGTTVDGSRLDSSGAWMDNGKIKTRIVDPGMNFTPGDDAHALSPAYARQVSVDTIGKSNPDPYHGRVYTSSDYVMSKREAADTGKLFYTEHCQALNCYNPKVSGGSYCELHTCREPGCTTAVASGYNCGYCYTHGKEHGVDQIKIERYAKELGHQLYVETEAAKAAEAARAAAAANSASSKKSSGSGSTSSGGSGSGNTGRTSGSTSSSASASSSGSSSAKSSTGSTQRPDDSYNAGYDAVMDHGDYDVSRYVSDWDYMLGVDDAMDELGEDW